METAERGQANKLRQEQTKARGLQSAGRVQTGVGRGMRALGDRMSGAGNALNQTGLGAVAGMPLKAAGALAEGAGRMAEKAGRVASLHGRLREQKALAQGLKNKATEAVTAPINQGSKLALRWAWIYLIPSWGLSLIYINLHVFLRVIFPKLFCKPGKEWVPESMQKAAGEAGSLATNAVGSMEYLALVALDLLLLLIIMAVAAIIIFVATDEVSTLDKVKIFWDGIF